MFYHYRAYRAAGSVVSSLVGCAMFSVLVVFGLAIGCVAERMAAVAWAARAGRRAGGGGSCRRRGSVVAWAARAGRRVEEKGNLPTKTWVEAVWTPCLAALHLLRDLGLAPIALTSLTRP